MVKRIYFGWNMFTKKATGETFKVLTIGKNSDQWHGIEVSTKYVDLSLEIPNCKPGAMLDVEFDERGNVESVSLSK